MAISVVATNSSTGSNGAAVSITFTSYTPVVDDIVVILAANGSTGSNLPLKSGWVNCHPSGASNVVASDSHVAACHYHKVTSTEATNGTQTYSLNAWPAGYGDYAGIVLRGVDPTTPLDSSAVGFNSANSATPHVLPALTGANLSSNSLVLGFLNQDNQGSASWTTPSGWTQRIVAPTTVGTGGVIYARNTLTTAGTDVLATNVTPAAGQEYAAFTVAFTEGVTASTGTIAATVSKPDGVEFQARMEPSGTTAATLQEPLGALLTGVHAQSGTMGATVSKPTAALSGTQAQSGTIAASLRPVSAALAGTGPIPKADTFTDTFTTKDVDKWDWGGDADVAGGQAVMTEGWATVVGTSRVYDLTDSSPWYQQ
jgi:hypothetical protein